MPKCLHQIWPAQLASHDQNGIQAHTQPQRQMAVVLDLIHQHGDPPRKLRVIGEWLAEAIPVKDTASSVEEGKAAVRLLMQSPSQADGQAITRLQMPQSDIRQRAIQQLRDLIIGRMHQLVRPMRNCFVQFFTGRLRPCLGGRRLLRVGGSLRLGCQRSHFGEFGLRRLNVRYRLLVWRVRPHPACVSRSSARPV
ncbi:hypothetical protein D3C85_1152070 [compost metagenome]